MASHRQFSSRAQKLLRFAHDEADLIRARDISSEHLLLGALSFGGYLGSALCGKSFLSLHTLRDSLGEGRRSASRYSKSTRAILRASEALARSFGDKRVDAAHIVLALLRERKGGASRVLDHFNVSRQVAQREVCRRLRSRRRPL